MGEKGLLTIVDEPTINPKHIIDWFIEAQKLWTTKVVADNFRMDLLRPLFEDAGIEYEVIKTLVQFNHYLHQELKICSRNIILSLVITL